MENGVMIIDKIEALPAIVIILLFVISSIFITFNENKCGLDIILLLSAISMSITIACSNDDRYEETKLEKFYADWDIRSKEGNITK